MGKTSKAKAGKLPKRIGGVKIPKDVRRAGARLAEVASSPAAKEAIAFGLSIAATLVQAAAKRDRAASAAAPHHDDPSHPATPKAPTPPANDRRTDPHEIGVALGRMAEAALAGLLKPRG